MHWLRPRVGSGRSHPGRLLCTYVHMEPQTRPTATPPTPWVPQPRVDAVRVGTAAAHPWLWSVVWPEGGKTKSLTATTGLPLGAHEMRQRKNLILRSDSEEEGGNGGVAESNIEQQHSAAAAMPTVSNREGKKENKRKEKGKLIEREGICSGHCRVQSKQQWLGRSNRRSYPSN